MLGNIPIELRAFRQFICWRYEDKGGSKLDKIPYCPHTGNMASVNVPNTWGTYDNAIQALSLGYYTGIGFVLTENDPFTFIDLDYTEKLDEINRQIEVHNAFDSYAEISPSGKGLHIIVKGKTQTGRRRSNIEIYSNLRYMTLTGNVYNNKPVSERQELVSILYNEMSKGTKTVDYDGTTEIKHSDDEIIAMAKDAKNGDKFKMYFNGEWKFIHQSQSEADFAFIDIIAFYTQNKEQIARIFRASPLGQRDKAKRTDYLSYMLNRAFDKLLPPINLDMLNNEIEKMKYEEKQKVAKQLEIKENDFNGDIPLKNGFSPPPGLVGEIAHYIYSSSIRPVPEIALAGAIGMVAGICGRAYNISGQGLNMYILLLAKTGRGKEAMATKTGELMNYVSKMSDITKSFVGPSIFASGQGLTRYLSDNPLGSMFSIIGEFGLEMQQLADPRNPKAALKKMLLDLYHKSGRGATFNPVAYSDKEKNTKTLHSPALTIIGESTPSAVYDHITEESIISGLLPRFLTIEYTGDRVPANKNFQNVKPSQNLLHSLSSVVTSVLMLTQNNQTLDVKLTPEAETLFDQFDIYCTNKVNKAESDALGELWNRTHIKGLRLAALISVGINQGFPCIDYDTAKWAIDFVKNDSQRIMIKFEKGKLGNSNSDNTQESLIIKAIRDYILKPYEKCAAIYDKSSAGKKMYDKRFIGYSYISKKVISAAPFRTDRLGATSAIKRCLQSMIDAGIIAEIAKSQAKEIGTTGRAFAIIDSSLLEE
jgi:hypothetical protein